MNYKKLLPVLVLCLTVICVKAQDTYLAAKKYRMHKGEKLDIYLLSGIQFKDLDEFKYDSSKTAKFNLIDGGKKINLMTAAKDSASPVLSNVMNNQGMAMVEMVRKIAPTPIDRDEYAKYLTDEGLTKLAETVNNSNQNTFKEKKTVYMKSLFIVDKPNGSDYEKQFGQEYEITLKKNPYKLNYGDEITGIYYVKGKPVKAATIDVFVKVASGNVYVDHASTNEKGEFSIIMNREGVYMLRTAQTVVSTTPDADFETTQTAFTFLFTNNNDYTLDWDRK